MRNFLSKYSVFCKELFVNTVFFQKKLRVHYNGCFPNAASCRKWSILFQNILTNLAFRFFRESKVHLCEEEQHPTQKWFNFFWQYEDPFKNLCPCRTHCGTAG